MTQLKFIDKINWRQILVHLLGTFFLVLSAYQFAILHDIGFIKTIDKYGIDKAIKQMFTQFQDMPKRITEFTEWIYFAQLFGILIGFVISLVLTIKNKRFWLNSLIVLMLSIFLCQIGLFHNNIIKSISFSFGSMFVNFGLQYKYLANGTILLIIGLIIFFSKWANNFAFKPYL